MRVQAQEASGAPISGVDVTFTPAQGSGAVTPARARTAADGVASGVWRLGTAAGTQTVVASANGVSTQLVARATPGAPVSLAIVSGNEQSGTVGQALAEPLVLAVRDRFGNGVAGVEVAFVVTGGGGAVSPARVATDSAGRATTRWTLGTGVGGNVLQAQAQAQSGALAPATLTATARAGPPAAVAKMSVDGQRATVATTLPVPVVVEVRDQYGNVVPGVSVAFTVSDSGSVSPATAQTDGFGRASTTWTLGHRAGIQSLEVRAGNAPPAKFSAVAAAGPPTALVKISGDGQGGRAGGILAQSLVVEVRDRFANPVPGETVNFVITGGGGSVNPAAPQTDSLGRASTRWTLGPSPGVNTLSATVAGLGTVSFTVTAIAVPPGYNITVRYVGSIPGSVQSAVNAAVAKWTSAITGDVADVAANLPAGSCAGVPYSAINEVVDDVLVYVQEGAIDGMGTILAQAGVCWVRGGGGVTLVGGIKIDTDDVSNMQAQGTLNAVVTHEMGHVVGIGTLWFGFVIGDDPEDPYYNDPHYVGANALAAYRALGGSHALGVPIENMGGEGTRDAHWRESSFNTELMTGYIDLGSNPLSTVSISALKDLGYAVSLGTADAYALPTGGVRHPAPPDAVLVLMNDVVREPRYKVDLDGRIRPVGPSP